MSPPAQPAPHSSCSPLPASACHSSRNLSRGNRNRDRSPRGRGLALARASRLTTPAHFYQCLSVSTTRRRTATPGSLCPQRRRKATAMPHRLRGRSPSSHVTAPMPSARNHRHKPSRLNFSRHNFRRHHPSHRCPMPCLPSARARWRTPPPRPAPRRSCRSSSRNLPSDNRPPDDSPRRSESQTIRLASPAAALTFARAPQPPPSVCRSLRMHKQASRWTTPVHPWLHPPAWTARRTAMHRRPRARSSRVTTPMPPAHDHRHKPSRQNYRRHHCSRRLGSRHRPSQK